MPYAEYVVVAELLQGKPVDDREHEKLLTFTRALVAEFIGTFALTMIAAGTDVVASVSSGQVSYVAKWVIPGLLVMVMIYTIGDISGAHINPAVTLAFALRRSFPWRHVAPYWVVQLVGAACAGLLLHALFGSTGHLGTTRPHHGIGTALVMEMFLSWLLILAILSTAEGHRLVGHNAGIAVGATIALDGVFGGPISGASMNPARSFGPALAANTLGDLWLYVLGPVTGALLATAVVWFLRGHPTGQEEQAATGEQKAS